MSTLIATFNPKKLEPYLDPNDARTLAVEMAASLVVARGTVLGQITASGKFSTYADANTDGTGVARAIAVYDFVTDASGNVILGPTGSAADLTHTAEPTAEVYWKGAFLVSDLTGYDAAALADMGGRAYGTGAAQWIWIP